MFRELSSSAGGFLLLTDEKLTSLNDRGDDASIDVPSDGLMVTQAFGRSAIMLELTALNRYNIG